MEANHRITGFGRILVLFACVCASVHVATCQATVKGRIMDEEKSPAQFANVVLLQPGDSAVVKGTVTDQDGFFLLPDVSKTAYVLMVSMIGYKNYYSPDPLEINGEPVVQLETITMERDLAEIDEVVIAARKPIYEIKLDRLVVNVASSIASSSSTALEILEQSPGVLIDRYNSSIGLNGKNGVLIMINGKLNRMPMASILEMLEGMPAEQINKIEIFESPPAKYDAEGAGLINLELTKSDHMGTNGRVYGNFGYRWNERYGIGGSINYKNDKLNVFGNYSFRNNPRAEKIEFIRKSTFHDTLYETYNQIDRDLNYRISQNVNTGLDYFFSSKTILGVMVNYSGNQMSFKENNSITNTVTPGEDAYIDAVRYLKRKSDQYLFNFNVNHQISDRQNIEFNADYIFRNQFQPQEITYRYFSENHDLLNEEYRGLTKNTPLHIYASKLDYSNKIGSKISVETGLKFTYSTFTNNVVLGGQETTEGFDLSENKLMDEYIGAGYVSLGYRPDEKTNMKAGLRYEHSVTTLSENSVQWFHRESGELFPTVFISREIFNDFTVRLSSNRRINRPSFNELAPLAVMFDPNALVSGNVELYPSFTRNNKLDFLYKRILIGFSYSREKNAIVKYQPVVNPDTKETFYRSVNLDRVDNYTIQSSIPFVVSNWWSMQNNFSAGKQIIQSMFNGKYKEIGHFHFNINTVQSFRFPKGYKAQVTFRYRSTQAFGFAEIRRYPILNIGVEKEFRKNRGTVSLDFSNVLKKYYKWHAVGNFTGQNLFSDFKFLRESPFVKLSYSKNFGNDKLKSRRNRKTGSSEELKRL